MTNDLTCARVTDRTSLDRAALDETRLPKGCTRIREAAFDDYDQIAPLQSRNSLTSRPYLDWITLWKSNPVYEELRHQFPIGWVLETQEGKIVGSIGNIPLACHFRGQNLRTAAACDWVVDPRYRSSSMHLLDRFMSQNDTDLFVTTTASANSERALRMFEWSRVPTGAWDKSAFWVTNYPGFAKSVLNLKSVRMPGFLSYPVSAALFCRDIFTHIEAGLDECSSELELCPGFDNRFDDFWDELKRQNDNVLLPHRSRETLAWHFRSPLMRQQLIILAKSKGSRLLAYAIFDRLDNPACGLKRMRLVDFQALKGFENILPSAICWMLRKSREDGIHILENVGCWLDLSRLPQLPKPYYRALSAALYYFHAPSKLLSEILNNPAVWAPTTFDGDASI
jgi:Acetyltransferase (GNAT) domain